MNLLEYILNKLQEKEYIPGGKAMGMNDFDLAKKHGVPVSLIKRQIRMGTKVELEHTPKRSVAREIASDHVDEFPTYYSALKRMEKKLEKD